MSTTLANLGTELPTPDDLAVRSKKTAIYRSSSKSKLKKFLAKCSPVAEAEGWKISELCSDHESWYFYMSSYERSLDELIKRLDPLRSRDITLQLPDAPALAEFKAIATGQLAVEEYVSQICERDALLPNYDYHPLHPDIHETCHKLSQQVSEYSHLTKDQVLDKLLRLVGQMVNISSGNERVQH